MKELFFTGGATYMAVLTILLITTTAWIIYHFIIAYSSKQKNLEKLLRKIGYGKSMGLFTMIVGIIGQMTGLYHMFLTIEDTIKNGVEVIPALIYGAIRVTMICTFYGIFIYLFSLLLWFVTTTMIEKKLEN
ncbi:MAG: MotA/TolQ/ExbB proton channel family protein [Flavobacteriaceae bacterium]|nr:MotA/TolQ/ExbB proton channel family protein [Flavobacteriaceae bacterium]